MKTIIALILVLIPLVAALGGCVILINKIDRDLKAVLKDAKRFKDELQNFRRRIEANGNADNTHK